MKTVRVRCRNVKGSTLLMDPMPDEKLREILTGVSAPQEREKPPEDVAAGKVYRNEEGMIGLPAKMLIKCLVLAGTKVSLKGKKNVTKADGSTELFSFLWVLDPFLAFTNIPADPEEQRKFWRVSLERGGQSQNRGKGGGAIAIVRPEFLEWEFTVTIRFDEKRVNEGVVKKLFTEGGLTQGLGSYRPNRGGNHGQFEVVEWTEDSEEASGELVGAAADVAG